MSVPERKADLQDFDAGEGDLGACTILEQNRKGLGQDP
jgi:hypothetical protein